jgi:hypothetical protein
MRKYFLLIFYVAVSLLIGREFHPFARFNMFNSFPNYSYVFYLNNERGEIVPFKRGIEEHQDDGAIAHKFFAYCDYHNCNCSYGNEDSAFLRLAGKELMGMILQGADTAKLNFRTLSLYRRYYHLQYDSIVYRDDLMYAETIKP